MRSIRRYLKIMAAAAACAVIAAPVHAASFGSVSDGWTLDTATGELRILTDDGMKNWRDSTKTPAIKNGTRTCYIAPEVTKILQNSFKGMSNLEAVTGAEVVTAIGGSAFEDCTGLVTMPEMPNLTRLVTGEPGENRSQNFLNCEKLGTAAFLKNVVELPIRSLKGCAAIKEVDILSSIERINNEAFKDSGIVKFKAISSASELSVNKSSFEGCASLKEIYLKAPLINMSATNALDGCTSLRKLYIDGSLENSSTRHLPNAYFKDTEDLEIYIMSIGHAPSYTANDPANGAVGLKVHLYEGEDRAAWLALFKIDTDSILDDIHLPNSGAWASDVGSHWHACVNHPDVPAADVAPHDVTPKDITNTHHTMECSTCGRTDTEPHDIRWTRGETTHSATCAVCGWSSGERAHEFGDWRNDPARHWRECACGAKDDEGTHDGAVCSVCGRSVQDDVIYPPVSGTLQVWSYSSGEEYVAKIDAPIERFTGVVIDAAPLDEDDFTVELVDGTTVISVKRRVMERLDDGTHVLTVLFSDGKCEIAVEVRGSGWSASSSGGACSAAGPLVWFAVLISTRLKRCRRHN